MTAPETVPERAGPADPKPAQSNGLADAEARQRIAKLELENKALSRQLSWHGILVEWLKATAVPVTLLGAVLAFYVGFRQLRQSEQNRLGDRFDKALTRLASKNPTERITGVSSLRLFMFGEGQSLIRASAHSLVDAIAYENDERVVNAIINVFADLKPSQLPQDVLNEVTKVAIEHNRSLTSTIVKLSDQTIERAQKEILARAGAAVAPDKIESPIPVSLINKLSTEQYLDFLDQYHSPFDQLDNDHETPLGGLAKIIPLLVSLGGLSTDFSGIYCQDCDFTRAKNLSGVDFGNSFLSGADLSNVNLSKSSFQNADIAGTNFYRANLTNANLSFTRVYEKTRGFRGLRNSFPLLECAKLQGANLNGTVLLVIVKSYATHVSGEKALEFLAPRLQSAEIDGLTKLSKFGVIVISSVSDSYLAKHPKDPDIVRLFDRQRFGGDGLFGGGWSNAPISRQHGTFSTDAAVYTDTSFTQRMDVEESRLKNYGSDETAILRTYGSPPALKPLSIMAKIADMKAEKPSQYVGNGLTWRQGPPDKCEGDKDPFNLVLSSGMHSISFIPAQP